jgi:hypothetical protein
MTDKRPLLPAVDVSNPRGPRSGWDRWHAAVLTAVLVVLVLVIGTAAVAFFSMEAY